MRSTWILAVAVLLAAGARAADPIPIATGDIPANFEPVLTLMDFEKREVMIPMRDGVKLFTIIVIPEERRAHR